MEYLILIFPAIWVVWLAWACVAHWRKGNPEKPETIRHIHTVREAAFAVIEASLQDEPEKWSVVHNGSQAFWVANDKADIALWVGTGPDNLRVAPYSVINSAEPPKSREVPPLNMKARLYTEAIAVAMKELELVEIARLEGLVGQFKPKLNAETRRDRH